MIDKVAELSNAGQRVVVYAEATDADTILATLDAGAVAFLAKHELREDFVNTVLEAAQDRPYVPPAMAGAIVGDRRADRPELSEREREALLLWFQSMSRASVARRMGISQRTVDEYVRRARIKYAQAGRPAQTKSAMLARAVADGLLHPPHVGAEHEEAPDSVGQLPRPP
ncbi:hypothetical protein GCM10011608_60780 [Micromonospora sonchi]|uniref:HTH luxR-type domain-containing protein n=2 Tax=Micromonospora sonchi TaxID=1763543 RepID=A0A917UB09_9ACTN|nr:hypothetical protein GCM10011608_60780 [Micromonospora sonchi]